MKNVLKLCLLMAMCVSLLLVVGCAKKDVEGTTEAKTETTEAKTGADDSIVELPIDINPEGNPTDAGLDEGVELGGDADSTEAEGTENTEDKTQIDVEAVEDEDQDTQPTENDFEIDFGELTE